MYCKKCRTVGGHKIDGYNKTQYICGKRRTILQLARNGIDN